MPTSDQQRAIARLDAGNTLQKRFVRQLPERRQASCSHAWILNLKPAVCLWCGARKTR